MLRTRKKKRIHWPGLKRQGDVSLHRLHIQACTCTVWFCKIHVFGCWVIHVESTLEETRSHTLEMVHIFILSFFVVFVVIFFVILILSVILFVVFCHVFCYFNFVCHFVCHFLVIFLSFQFFCLSFLLSYILTYLLSFFSLSCQFGFVIFLSFGGNFVFLLSFWCNVLKKICKKYRKLFEKWQKNDKKWQCFEKNAIFAACKIAILFVIFCHLVAKICHFFVVVVQFSQKYGEISAIDWKMTEKDKKWQCFEKNAIFATCKIVILFVIFWSFGGNFVFFWLWCNFLINMQKMSNIDWKMTEKWQKMRNKTTVQNSNDKKKWQKKWQTKWQTKLK